MTSQTIASRSSSADLQCRSKLRHQARRALPATDIESPRRGPGRGWRLGPLTLAACERADQARAVDDYATIYEAFYRRLKTFPVFGRGWLNRLRDVTEQARAWASEAKTPEPSDDADMPGGPSWLARAVALRGLYEHRGGADNPVILEMARVCGGEIAQSYVHDAIPWCALFVNYCLIASGRAGNDSLWALNFSHYGTRLPGPAVGAIATKRRSGGGGHVFFVLGRDAQGRIVGIGGNQSDMVCDDEFDPNVMVAYTWPDDVPPTKVGGTKTDISVLPVVTPTPKARRDVELPA